MRVVASVQAKRGSSRGLVHYLAHSKLDTEREPEHTRELFSEFTDILSVKSANNSMRVGIATGRPENDELHHLVLSFRSDDYRKLGADEERRRKALKEITRAAMKRLETAMNAERLLWSAAVHRNTQNPHVHIAIQKQYLSREIDRQVLTKIPREVLPHYEIRGSEKVLLNGHLIDAATEKMGAIIGRERTPDKAARRSAKREVSIDQPGRSDPPPVEGSPHRNLTDEREALAKGILAEYELCRIEARIESLLDHRDEMRFIVSDPITGRKRRLSLREIEQRGSGKGSIEQEAPARQIKTILHKMLAKEEAAKDRVHLEFGDALQESKKIRDEYRKNGRKLPVPALTKEELDKLQKQCLETSGIRRFSYLEKVRTELERKGDVKPRSKDDLESILVQKDISNLRFWLSERKRSEMSERGYYLRLDIGNRSMSLAQLDREQNQRDGSVLSIFEKLRNTATRLSKKTKIQAGANKTDVFRSQIVDKLDEQLEGIRKDSKAEQNKAKILGNILDANPDNRPGTATGSPEQIAEIETLSSRLKLKPEYERNWKDQRILIESGGSDCAAYKRLIRADPNPDFNEYKNRVLAGRSLAREIVSRTEFNKAKEDLKTFKDGKRFQKFAIADKRSGSISYLSLHDVDLSHRGSLLDRALAEVLEGHEHRTLRRTVVSVAEERERRLKDDVTTAKEFLVSATRTASEFKESYLFGLRSETRYQPIFTSAEITTLELCVENTRDPKEAERLRTVLESVDDKSMRSLTEVLRDFENPERGSVKNRDIGLVAETNLGDERKAAPSQREQDQVGAKTRSFSDRFSQGYSR